nr:solute carrier family 43 member 3-like [Salvelinus alpinus]
MLFYTTNAQVGNLFDSHRSTVISVYAGAFDSSAAVFLIIKFLYERGGLFPLLLPRSSVCSVIHVSGHSSSCPRPTSPTHSPTDTLTG